MEKVELSIIVPTFNSEKIIENAIKRLDYITNKVPTEIIIINDGSTDDTANILDKIYLKYANLIIINQRNLKQSIARNKGLNLATGKYVMFFDDDDEYDSEIIDKMLSLLEHNNNKLAICGIQKSAGNSNYLEIHSKLSKVKDNEKLITTYLTRNLEMDVGLWNKTFLREIIVKNNICFSNENFFEDSLFVLEYLTNINFDEISFIEEPLYILKKQKGTSTTTLFNSRMDGLAHSYDNKVKKMVGERVYNQVKSGFRARLYMHCVHHHIKYDRKWNSKKQVLFLKTNKVDISSIVSHISIKYKLALLQMMYMPRVYINLYKKSRSY